MECNNARWKQIMLQYVYSSESKTKTEKNKWNDKWAKPHTKWGSHHKPNEWSNETNNKNMAVIHIVKPQGNQNDEIFIITIMVGAVILLWIIVCGKFYAIVNMMSISLSLSMSTSMNMSMSTSTSTSTSMSMCLSLSLSISMSQSMSIIIIINKEKL